MAEPGYYQGKHYTEWVYRMHALKKSGEHQQLEELLLGLVAAAEEEAHAEGRPPAPAYTLELAILYRKQKAPEAEVAILERYKEMAGGRDHPKVAERLRKARARLETATATPPVPACPSCGITLDSMPTRSRNCPRCEQRIVVRSKHGVKLLLTENQDKARKREEEQGRARERALIAANRIGVNDAAFVTAEADAKPGMSPADVFWGLANQQVLEEAETGRWDRAALVYREMATFLANEGREATHLTREAVVYEVRAQERYWQRGATLAVTGCVCPACSEGRQEMDADALRAAVAETGELPATAPIPHDRCENGVCQCRFQEPYEPSRLEFTVDVAPVEDDQPRQRSLLRRLFGG